MILCAGESLIDMVPEGGGFLPLPGGAVYNTALALGRLGAPVSYFWPISNDGFGQRLLDPLTAAGVETALCPRTDRLTTLAFVTLRSGEAQYAFYDDGSAGRMLTPRDLPDLSAGTRALFIGGISLVPDPCGSAVEVLVAKAQANGVPVMLDPNIRPFFITDPAAFRARLNRLIAAAQIVKLSLDDLLWLFPDQGVAALPGLLTGGPQLVFLSKGAAGAEVHWQDGVLSLPAAPAQVVDTIGAGDTFNAGVLASLHHSGALGRMPTPPEMLAALDMGLRAAAIAVSRPGANPPWASELTS